MKIIALAVSMLALAGCGGTPAVLQAADSPAAVTSAAPAASPDPSFACAVMTFNEDTAAVNQSISSQGTDSNGAKPPEFRISVTVGSQDASVGSVTVIGYDSIGSETGSTTVNIGQVITAGQVMTFWASMPDDGTWYQVTENDQWGNPTVYQAAASTCRVESWSSP